jgi:hypothetical protein
MYSGCKGRVERLRDDDTGEIISCSVLTGFIGSKCVRV